jgi:mutator protein MutT
LTPKVGVGGVVIHQGKVLLARRGKEPLRGRWTVPGGTVEAGETLEQALVREVEEETGLTVRSRELLLAFDRIERSGGELRYHYVILDYLCDYETGVARAGSDVDAVAWVSLEDLPAYDLPPLTREVVLEGFRRSATSCREPGTPLRSSCDT